MSTKVRRITRRILFNLNYDMTYDLSKCFANRGKLSTEPSISYDFSQLELYTLEL